MFDGALGFAVQDALKAAFEIALEVGLEVKLQDEQECAEGVFEVTPNDT